MIPRWSSVLCLAAVGGCGEPPAPAPTVATAEVIRGALTLEREGYRESVQAATRAEQGATAVTGADGRGDLRLDRGARLLLDHSSRVKLALERVELEEGRIWADIRSNHDIEIVTSHGTLTAKDATFAVERSASSTKIHCASGEVTFHTPAGNGNLAQGEQVELGLDTRAPRVEGADIWEDWTGGLAEAMPRQTFARSYVGSLAGRLLDAKGVARGPMPVRSHEVDVAIRGDLAETTVTQTFFNARSDTLEGEYLARIPEDAIVESFAVNSGERFVDGTVQSVAASGYEAMWRDATEAISHLAYDGPGRLRARVYPVAPGATVAVRFVYTQWLDRQRGRRTYHYPMLSEGAPASIAEFVLKVDINGAVGALRAGMGAEVEGGKVVLRQSDFQPQADFYLDLFDAEPAPTDQARAYSLWHDAPEGQAEGDQRYVLFDIPTEAIEGRDPDAAQPPLELVVLMDVSGATDDEDLGLARGVVETVLKQLAPEDRVTIRLADLTAHVPAGATGELQPASAANGQALLEAAAQADLGGATDLGTVLRDAARVVAGRPRGAVLYLGDGIPTAGALDATSIRQVLETVDAPPRFFALAVGDGANLGLLRALFGDQAMAVRDRTQGVHAVARVLAEAARPTLRGVSLDLGESVERVFPAPPLTVPHGAHIRVVGRLVDDLPESIVVRGRFDGSPFEQSFKVSAEDVQDGGDIRRRWATSRLSDLIDSDAGREALVELGTRFGILTPWTSFVIGGQAGVACQRVTGFDRDPNDSAWALSGGMPEALFLESQAGWHRRMRTEEPVVVTRPESTWVSRVSEADVPASRGGDDGLSRAAVARALALGTRGPEGCFERELAIRPDLQGDVTVSVTVDGAGVVTRAAVVSSTLGEGDVPNCVVTEVGGLRFPATGAGSATTVVHTYTFVATDRAIGTRRHCSDASHQSLDVRQSLWHERLAAGTGALSVWREAQAQCELDNWRSRRVLLQQMLAHVGTIPNQIALYRAFAQSSAAAYLRRAILQNVRTPWDVQAVRQGLGMEAQVDWSFFSRLWKSNTAPEARLTLVRRWLEVIPDDIDLRLRLLALLEETHEIDEAKRIARELRGDPLADANVRMRVGEFWLRQDAPDEARRVFSEIVELAPLDPWARERLGDLYRAHGRADDAYREYMTLARLVPDRSDVWLKLALAAADSGRTDEALRLEQRVGEYGVEQGAPGVARLWTMVRLARLKADAGSDAARGAEIRRRERLSSALRDAPAIFAALTWSHPEDAPEFYVHYPSTPTDAPWERAPLVGGAFGIEAVRVREREDGEYGFEVRRTERDNLRDLEAELLVIVAPSSVGERILRIPVTLSREQRTKSYRLAGNELVEVPGRRVP